MKELGRTPLSWLHEGTHFQPFVGELYFTEEIFDFDSMDFTSWDRKSRLYFT